MVEVESVHVLFEGHALVEGGWVGFLLGLQLAHQQRIGLIIF